MTSCNICRAKADYLAKIGDKEGATEAYALTEKKTAGAAQKLDLVFSLMRSAHFVYLPSLRGFLHASGPLMNS